MRLFTRIPWILLLLLLIGVAWSIRPVSDPDILWHLRTGQWMLEQGDVIRHDVFSATRQGCVWVSVPWLYEVMIAQLHATLGWGGLTLWQVVMLLAITLQTTVLVWLLRRSNSSGAMPHRWNWKWPCLSVPAALAVLLTLRLLQMRINCRPEWNTYLFIGAYLIIMTVATKRSAVRRQRSEDSGQRTDKAAHPTPPTQHLCSLLLWLLPVLQVLWTNTHGAFILGPLLVWGYVAAAWLGWLVARLGVAEPFGHSALSSWPKGSVMPGELEPAPVRLSLAAMLTTLACLVTPYGLAGTFYPFHLFHVLTDPLYKNGIVEGQSVDLAMTLNSGSLGYVFLACWVFAGLGLLGRLLEGVLARRSGFLSRTLGVDGCAAWTHNLHLGYLFACAAMAYLSLSAIRNVPLLPLVVAPLVASGIEYAADGLAAGVARICAMRRTKNRGQRSEVGGQTEPRTLNPEDAFLDREQSVAERGVSLLHSRTAHMLAQVLLALALICLYRSIVSERFYESLGWRMRFAIGYSDHEHPLAACDFVTRHRLEISCHTLYGDTRSANLFLARFGPQWPVYFDGRHAEIYDPPIFRTAARTRTNPEIFMREAATYGIGVVCFSLTDLKEELSPLAVALGQTNTWRLVYLDDCAAVFSAVTPAHTAFVARYGLPCVPAHAMLQRPIFADWLKRQGRADLAALHDPANQSLEKDVFAGGIVNALQLDGLWASNRHLEPLRFCRLASFVEHLGWSVVADDLYQQALGWPERLPVTLPLAIRHAHAVSQAVSDPELQNEMRARVRTRALALQKIDPKNPVVVAALESVPK